MRETRNTFFFVFIVSVFLSDYLLSYNSLKYKEWGNAAQSKLYFEENRGQFRNSEYSPKILFKAQVNGADIYITEKGLTYFFSAPFSKNEIRNSLDSNRKEYRYERFDIDIKNASIQTGNVIKESPSAEDYNFIYGHCPNGVFGVKHYEKITFKNVYPGIDWVLYSQQKKGLKYDFIIHPGADPRDIHLIYKSLNQLSIKDGNITLPFFSGTFSELAPVSFLKDKEVKIETQFQITEQTKKSSSETDFYETEIAFKLQAYNRNETLLIDPFQQWWGTYYGGTSGSEGVSIDTDSTGNVYVLGNTDSPDIPTQSYGSLAYFQGINAGATTNGYLQDCFILKFTNLGQLIWATYMGGSNRETGQRIKCDSYGNIFITGKTDSENFPVKNPGGNSYYKDSTDSPYLEEIFIAKFSGIGQYLWGTYYGTNKRDYPGDMCVSKTGNIYITGNTASSNFPLLNPGGGVYFDGSYGGGWQNPDDAFVLKFSNSGQLLLSSYLGGDGYDYGCGVTTDINGNVYVVGYTASTNFYVKNPGNGAYYLGNLLSQGGNYNGFILKLDSADQALWSTYLGGTSSDVLLSVVADKLGNVFMCGASSSQNFPTVNPGNGAFYLASNLQARLVLLKVNAQSQLAWSTFFGTFGNSGFPSLSVGRCNEVYYTVSVSPYCQNCPPMQIFNPGNGAYIDSTFSPSSPQYDIFISAFSNNCALKWGTFFGGDRDDHKMIIAADKNGDLFYTGEQGSVGYNTPADFLSYSTKCLVNPGGATYFQASPSYSQSFNTAYCVIGKFTGPSFSSLFSTAGCGSTNSASIQTVSGWGPYTYTWSTGSHNDSIANQPQGTYSYSITDTFFGCTESKTFFLGLPSLTLNVNSTDTSICIGNSVTFSVSGANSFSWSPAQTLNSSSGSSVTASPVTTSNYTVTGYNSPTCKSDTVINVTVNPLPVIKVTGKDSVCRGSSVTLAASGATQFSWSPAGSFTSVNNTTATSIPINDEVYGVAGKDQNGCIDSSTFKVSVISLPQLSISGPSTLCIGNTVTLTASGAEKLRWNKIDTLVHKDTAIIVVSPNANTTYSLSGITGNLCKDSTSISITVFKLPKLFLESPDSVCPKKNFTLSAKGSGEFNWEPVDLLNCTQCSDPVAKITGPTLFYVNLKDSNTCVSRDSALVEVRDDCFIQLIIPNIFTPNNDNSNDVFKLTGKNVSSVNCYIFSRWGKLIHSFDSMDGYWNGEESSGVNNADAVYFYVITATDTWKEEHIYKGTIQLIR